MIEYGKFDKSKYNHCFIVTDNNVAGLYKISGDNVFVLPQGEVCKSFTWAEKLCEWLLTKQADKTETVVALGGGCVGDLVGFVASIYKRGMKILYVPTTLLAMVDSAIGGKTAINLNGIKNAVGSFVDGNTLIDVNFLKTLPVEQITNGMGEVKKYAMLSEEIFELYSDDVDKNIKEIISACAEYKQLVVNQDKFDKGIRRKLNLGHTVAHALELKLGLSHGVAVEYGLSAELDLAVKLKIATETYREKLVYRLCLPELCHNLYQYIEYMRQDKKNGKEGITFCLPSDGFNIVEKTLTEEKLAELWQC